MTSPILLPEVSPHRTAPKSEDVPTADARLVSGSAIGGYRIERWIGQGGMGAVYEATQVSLNRRVALKVMLSTPADPETQLRFRREALLQAALDHPHIVDVYETGVCDGRLFIAMRLVRGATLRVVLRRGSIGIDAALRLLGPVADALDEAHACGLVHRDVKPENILVGPHEHAYLADFGLVRRTADASLTQPGLVCGTPGYLAPECRRGGAASPASDIYAFAAVLRDCLAAQLATRPSAITPSCLEAVRSGLAADPESRPATAGELMALAMADRPVGGQAPAPPATNSPRRRRSFRGSPWRRAMYTCGVGLSAFCTWSLAPRHPANGIPSHAASRAVVRPAGTGLRFASGRSSVEIMCSTVSGPDGTPQLACWIERRATGP
jgi:serine/threonine protein kinase